MALWFVVLVGVLGVAALAIYARGQRLVHDPVPTRLPHYWVVTSEHVPSVVRYASHDPLVDEEERRFWEAAPWERSAPRTERSVSTEQAFALEGRCLVASPLGGVKRIDFDPKERTVAFDGGRILELDRFGRVVFERDYRGQEHRYKYESARRLPSVTRRLPSVTCVRERGRLTGIRVLGRPDRCDGLRALEYDSEGRLTGYATSGWWGMGCGDPYNVESWSYKDGWTRWEDDGAPSDWDVDDRPLDGTPENTLIYSPGCLRIAKAWPDLLWNIETFGCASPWRRRFL
jgi:YD repeat-containing protein